MAISSKDAMKANLLCLLLLLARGVSAGESSYASGIDGFVTSDIQAVVAGATVGVDGLANGLHREAVTDSSGYYLVDNLRPGAYSVWAEFRGYGCIIYPHIPVVEGQRRRQNFHFVRAKRLPPNCEPLGTRRTK
ncbi:MAG TPA: carboxypeptidase-like regulatory domain-containing protein [Bryobacteraceae bacterium]|nr:carboxypeptidase-like regulatory domain-containing protein [Bryobacteraceae bacterium]